MLGKKKRSEEADGAKRIRAQKHPNRVKTGQSPDKNLGIGTVCEYILGTTLVEQLKP